MSRPYKRKIRASKLPLIGLWNLKCETLATYQNVRMEKGKWASNLETYSTRCEVASCIRKLTKDALGEHKRTEIGGRETGALVIPVRHEQMDYFWVIRANR